MPEPRGRPPVWLIFAVTATGIMANSIVAPLLPDIVADLGVSDAASSLIISSVAFPGVFMAPVIGILADRVGRRAVLVPCLAIFGIAGVIVLTAVNLPMLIVGRVIQGVGAAGLINLSVVIIGDHWDGPERTRLIGRNAAVLTVGLAFFPVVAGAIAELSSWRIALLPQVLALAVATIAWFTLDGGRPETRITVRAQLGGLGVVLRRPIIRATIAAGFITFVLIFGIFLTTLPIHLERDLGLGAAGRGVMLSVPAVSASLVAFNLGRLSTSVSRRRLLVGATIVFFASFAMMGVVPSVMLMAVACALYGLGDGILIPILQDIAVDEAPTAQRGGVVALWVSAARLGQSVGPLLAAAVFALSSTSGALLAGAALALGLIALVALGPLARSRPPVTV